MKKYIIVGVLVALLIGLTASAKVSTAKDSLKSYLLTTAGNVSVYVFYNGGHTCYVAGSSISCVK